MFGVGNDAIDIDIDTAPGRQIPISNTPTALDDCVAMCLSA